MKTVADQFAEILAAVRVKRIYGIVGDSLNGLTDALRRQGKIEWVHVRHEEVAAFAADGETQLTGEPVACSRRFRASEMYLHHGLFLSPPFAGPLLPTARPNPVAQNWRH